MKMSLRNRFMLPLLLLVTVGMGASTAVSYFKSKTALVDANNNQTTQLAESTLNMLEAWAANRILEISNWSQQKVYRVAVEDTFVGKAARKSANLQLAKLKEDYKFYENIFIVCPDGDIVASSDEALVGSENVNLRTFFKEGIRGNRYVSEVTRSKITGNPIFTISYPIIRKDKTVIGVFFGVIDVNFFSQRFISSIKVGTTGYAFIIKKDGVVIAHPDNDVILKMNVNEFAFGPEVLKKLDGLIESKFEGGNITIAFNTDPLLGWTIGIVVPTKEILGAVRSVGFINLSVTSAIIVLMAILILLIVSSTVKPVNRSIEGIENAVEQVAAGAGEVAFSSQALSNNASQQAASIEETSASLKEMAVMTSQNADHAGEAKSKMTEVSHIIQKVSKQMSDMSEAIDEITKSSEETSKIIKTIDEIAFQTNLLSLNASVEAARAGEAGAGFAVVADEVRTLAKKSAEAAKDTAELIEKTIKAVQNGATLNSATWEAFQENIEISDKIDGLVEEIAAASSEQARGISEINRAVAEMDNVVHQVAATAEESASASEEMSGQAEEMKGFVRNLATIVSGSINSSIEKNKQKSTSKYMQKNLSISSQIEREPNAPAQQTRKSSPRQLTSLEGDDFKDF